MMLEMFRILVVCQAFFSIGHCQMATGEATGEANQSLSDRLIHIRSTSGKSSFNLNTESTLRILVLVLSPNWAFY